MADLTIDRIFPPGFADAVNASPEGLTVREFLARTPGEAESAEAALANYPAMIPQLDARLKTEDLSVALIFPPGFAEAVRAAGPEGLSLGEFLEDENGDNDYFWREFNLPERDETIGHFFDRLGISEDNSDILHGLLDRTFHQWARAGLANQKLTAEIERLKGEIAILRGDAIPTQHTPAG